MNKEQAEKRLIKQQDKQRSMIEMFQKEVLTLHKSCMIKYGFKQGTVIFKTKVEETIKKHGILALGHGELLANDKINKV
ncbi:MAG: hypothetical protein K8R79_07320 [Calditrichales bacterium]|nr:hypothetical protein [Calditrichales bacterium]